MRNARRIRCALLLLVGTSLVSLYVLFPGRSVKPPTARQTSGLPLILMWTSFFDSPKWSMDLTLFTCNTEPACLRTSNRSALNASALVVFHLSDVRLDDLPVERPRGQLWALHTEEPPVYEPWLPDALQGAINWTATYRTDSDLTLLPRLQKVPIDRQPQNWWANKSRHALWLVSNCKTLSNREGFVRELSKFVEVDVVGACGTTVDSCLPKMSDKCYPPGIRDLLLLPGTGKLHLHRLRHRKVLQRARVWYGSRCAGGRRLQPYSALRLLHRRLGLPECQAAGRPHEADGSGHASLQQLPCLEAKLLVHRGRVRLRIMSYATRRIDASEGLQQLQ
ncbi:hypothetical protein HPB48_003776 [Haemaphysalis longicornis]|uniref:Fucosyltransferase n=1 Tax=Haemaphysalis longicornis TaxID=44386 RepID=A0A9J6FGH6_HAELO|nr:hypothetical protein HPB48_003776 [Haemaphysalis longicornis]